MKKYFISVFAVILAIVITYFVTDFYSSRRARLAIAASFNNMNMFGSLDKISSWEHLDKLLASGCVDQALAYVQNERNLGLSILKVQLKNGAKLDKTIEQHYSSVIKEAKAFTRRPQQQVLACNALAPIGFDTYGDGMVTNPKQLWAIKLSGIPVEINHDSQVYLAPGARNAHNQASIHAMLSKKWGINSRADLLNKIKSLQINGEAPVFMRLAKIVEKGLSAGKTVRTILAEQKGAVSDTNYNYLVFIANHIHKFEGKDLTLWDLGRAISLARYGYEEGYLGEPETWAIIMPIAEKLRTRYSSWKQYGQLYSLARATWAAGFYKGNLYYSMTNKIVAQLLEGGEAWATSPWPTGPVTSFQSRVN